MELAPILWVLLWVGVIVWAGYRSFDWELRWTRMFHTGPHPMSAEVSDWLEERRSGERLPAKRGTWAPPPRGQQQEAE